MDVTVQRNAFGSQLDSFEAQLSFAGIAHLVQAAFIRAPIVSQIGPDVQVLAKLDDGRIVAVRQANLLGISFHPEVTGETSVHMLFAEMCRTAKFDSDN